MCRSDLEETPQTLVDFGTLKYCLYGGNGYNRRWFIEILFQGKFLQQFQKSFVTGELDSLQRGVATRKQFKGVCRDYMGTYDVLK